MKKSRSPATYLRAASLRLLAAALTNGALAAPGDLDLSFDPGSGVNGPVNALAVQPDGKMIIGGEFTTVKGLARRNIARLNADGTGDSGFNASLLSAVYSLVLQVDGKVLVGHFSGIARLNSDGSADTHFNAITFGDFNYSKVLAIAVQGDGMILIGGNFYTDSYTGIARLNSDGTFDDSFTPPPADVQSMVLQPDGKVIIGGTAGGPFNGIARLNTNGTVDASFDTGTGLTYNNVVAGWIDSIALQTDGKILMGGAFTAINGTNRNNLARLNTNGGVDTNFNAPLTNQPPGPVNARPVYAVSVQADGRILAGGRLNFVNGTTAGLVRLNSNGSVDATLSASPSAPVRAITPQADGKRIIAGDFVAVNGVISSNVARLDANDSLDSTFNAGDGLNAVVNSVVLQPDGKLLIGGGFTAIKGLSRSAVARLNPDGSGDGMFNGGTNPAALVNTVALQPDGKMLVLMGNSVLYRLNTNGTADTSFSPDIGDHYTPDDYSLIFGLAIQPDSKILVGGITTHFFLNPFCNCWDYYTVGFVNRLFSNGSRDPSFADAEPSDTVRAIAWQSDGKILIGGDFLDVNFTDRSGIARLNANGSLDNSFDPGTGTTGIVNVVDAIIVQPDGKVLIGGGFTAVNGTNRRGIARLNASGSLDAAFDPGAGAQGLVYTLAQQPDGKIFVGGSFTSFDGSPHNGIVRLNANGTRDDGFGASIGTNEPAAIYSIALQADGNVLIGGSFSTVSGVFRPFLARLSGDALSPFATWAASFGLTGASAGAASDPESDGLANGVEFVLGGNPTLSDSASERPAVAVGSGYLTFTFVRGDPSEALGVTLTVESGTDLINWPGVFAIGPTTAASSPGVTVAENGAAPDLITVSFPIGSEQSRFARLKVTISP